MTRKTTALLLAGALATSLMATAQPAAAHYSRCTTAAYTPKVKLDVIYASGRAHCPHSHAMRHGMYVYLFKLNHNNRWVSLGRAHNERWVSYDLYVNFIDDCSPDGRRDTYRTGILHYREGREGTKFDPIKYSYNTTRDC